MGYQTSETHEEFRAQPAISEPHDPAYNPRGFLIEGHLKNGPSQVSFATGYYIMLLETAYLSVRQMSIL